MRLTTMERRAKAACDEVTTQGRLEFHVVWKRSSMWGLNPCINFRGAKAAIASGCGYDKLSAVVAEFLSALVPTVGHKSGCGIDSVIEELKLNGWELKHTYNGKTEDGFELRRK